MIRTHKLMLPFMLLLLAMCLASCGGGGDETTGLGGSEGDLVPEIQVQNVDHRFRIPGWSDVSLDPDPIFALISSATASLDIAVPRVNRQEVVERLLNEAQSGTQIRIVTEKAYYESPTYQPFYDQLENPALNSGNIQIRTDNDGTPRMMHARFLVIDQARVVTGSYNWETVDSESTFGNVVSILNTSVAAAFTNQFNQMFVERNFGVNKRNDTQHTFLVGAGNGLLEVYFGPTDLPREILQTEIGQSQNVVFAVQQFKDVPLAEFLLNWISADAEFNLVGWFNDFGPLGDQEENAVYSAFASYLEVPTGGSCFVNSLIDPNFVFVNYNTMNHKLLFADHGLSDGLQSIVDTTGNFSDMAFTLNDEVMLVMRGSALINKYWSGINFNSPMPPRNVTQARDVKEIDQVLAMYPYLYTPDGQPLRPFDELPCGIVIGEVSNFRETITVLIGDGEFEDLDIDLVFTIEGDLFFGGTLGESPAFIGDEADHFVRSEIMNPDHLFQMVVPAGEITLRMYVSDPEGGILAQFQPDEQVFEIAPGGVRNLKMTVNQAAQSGGTTGGGSGGGGGGV